MLYGFLSIDAHRNPQGMLFKCRFSKSGMGPGSLHFFKSPRWCLRSWPTIHTEEQGIHGPDNKYPVFVPWITLFHRAQTVQRWCCFAHFTAEKFVTHRSWWISSWLRSFNIIVQPHSLYTVSSIFNFVTILPFFLCSYVPRSWVLQFPFIFIIIFSFLRKIFAHVDTWL